jgi:hypothetical protein
LERGRALPRPEEMAKSHALVIPQILDWSDGEIEATIRSYDPVGGKAPDTRRKMAGYYPPHPMCKCALTPIYLEPGRFRV